MHPSLFELIDRAKREGRHGEIQDWRTVCQGCNEWVSGIWCVTEAGKRLCRACSPADKRDRK